MRTERKPRGWGREAEDIKQILIRSEARCCLGGSRGGKEDDEGWSVSKGRAKRWSMGSW